MSQVNTLREIALSRAIDGQLDKIVQDAGTLARQLQGSGMRENQLRNALNVALHTNSMEVVGNYIRYQIGRGRDWQNNDFGENVITALGHRGSVHQAATAAASEAREQLQEAQKTGKLGEDPLPDQAELVEEAQLKLSRLFLGYLNRWFLYADRQKAWDKIEPLLRREEASS